MVMKIRSFKLIFLLCFFSVVYAEAIGNDFNQQESEYIEDQENSENDLRAPRPTDSQNGFAGPGHISGNSSSINSFVSQRSIRGPAFSTPNAVALFADSSGTLLKNSSVLVDALGDIQINGITKNGNTAIWPSIVGSAGTFLGSDGAGNLIYATPLGSGNVSTAAPFTVNNSIITADLPNGSDNIKQSNVTLDNINNINGVNTLNANVVNAPTLNGNALSATNFSGPLAGDVIGTQGATVVSLVGGQSAANVASGAVLANAATNNNTPNSIVLRDGSGNFFAGTITANLSGNATTATSATTAGSTTNFTGPLVGDVTGTQGATVVSFVGGQSAANVAVATTEANNATNADMPNTIVKRDASGNFSAGIITANLSGNATTATSATTAGSTTNFTGPLVGDVTGTQGATVVSLVGGQSAATIASGAVAANAATNANTPNTIVKRDGSGSFSAGTITANIVGNVTGNLSGNATSATTANSATNFTGSLAGDVIGTQGATVVNSVGGQTAANVASGTVLANAATNNNTAGTIVRRDGSGNFSAGIITANLLGNATSATTAVSTTNFTGSLAGDVTGTQGATVVSLVGGQSAANVAAGSSAANAATDANTPNTIVKRDGSGNFSAGIITANLSGNATTATSATTAGSTTSFTGPLVGDVTGTQGATVVSLVGGQSAAVIASGAVAANAATNANTPNTIVLRDGSGNFAANIITANLVGNVTGNLIGNATSATTAGSATNFTGSLVGDVTGTQAATVVSLVGGQSAGVIASGAVAANAATSSNTAGTIVKRDGSGNFSAGTITANLVGNATSATTATSSTNFTGSLVGDVTGTQGATVVSLVGGQTAANVAAATTAANAATSSDTPNTIVLRDGSGNFSAGTITANLTGNVTGNLTGNATSATTANSATNFTGSLVGDVTGTQGATVVSLVGGQSAATIASGAVAANAATNSNTANTIVKRDGSGNFSASTITANLTGNVIGNLTGNATSATTAGSATNFTGSLAGDVTGTQGATVVSTVGGQTAATIAAATTATNAATSSNTAGTIVKRDGSGNFSAGTISADLAGNVTGNLTGNVVGNVTGNLTGNATSATTAVSATNFTGSLAGDVTGTQGATVVSLVGGQSAATVAAATVTVNAATNNDMPNTLVLRDAFGNFATNMITIDGTITNPNDAATKQYVDSAISTGLSAKTPAVVVSTVDVPLTGLQTIDGVTLVDGDRVLLVAQLNPIGNGLWVAHAGAWTRPADFASGSTAGQAYVLILSGAVNAGSSWLCNTPTAVIDTDPIMFVEFSLPGQTTGANVGTGAGQVFRDKTGVTLNFKTIAAGPHMVVTNNANDITLSTDATDANTPSTIVARDGSGNFSAGTITASLIGAASLNVLKAGDTMTGNLNLATQSELRLQDAAGGEYVGLRAPTTVPLSYTVDLPSTVPTAGQVLQAISPTALQWATVGGSPGVTETYYVSLDGNDSNNGSFGAPFRTVAHAVNVANGVANLGNPIVINIGAGFFAEDNTGGPITITADGISIVGSSESGTTILPFSSAIDLFNITTASVEFNSLSLLTPSPGSTASAISLTANSGGARFVSMLVSQFQTAFNISSGTGAASAVFEDIATGGNGTVISINNMQAVIKNSLFQGPSLGTTAANMGIVMTGIKTQVAILSCIFNLFDTALLANGGSVVRILSSDIEATTNGIVGIGSSDVSVIGCNFLFNNPSSINVSASGAGTDIVMEGCHFQCTDTTATPQGTAVQVIQGAEVAFDSCAIEGAVVGIQCGAPTDTISTILNASGAVLEDCITDVLQQGSSRLNFFSGVFNPEKTTISNPTNVSFAAFDDEAILAIGTTADIVHPVYEILNGQLNEPRLIYQPTYYGYQGTVYANPNSDQIFNATQAQSNNAAYFVVTGDRTKQASINVLSDTSGTFGTGNNIRGWGINKVGTSASLAFTYTNNDTSGQAARGSNTVMQLNGFDNQVEFPLATNAPLPTNTVAKLVWATDTNLYRSAANTLKTDGNLIVGGLTPAGVVHNDATGLLSTSLIVNADVDPAAGIVDTKLATISTPGKVANSATTATSANTPNTIVLRDGSGNFSAGTITAALVGAASLNVLKSGDTMTGNLNLAAQSELRLQDAAGGEYVGLRAPTTVPSSYTVDLPSTAPISGQFLQASSPTALQWATVGGSPAAAKTYYVALNGSDTNDGSLSAPFRTVAHAVAVVNGVASMANPIVISVGAGRFVENNSGGPITITASGISIIGSAPSGTIILPLSTSTDLFAITTANIEFDNFTLQTTAIAPVANAVTLTAGSSGIARFNSIAVSGLFQTGFAVSSGVGTPSVLFNTILCAGCATAISLNNIQAVIKNSIFQGSLTALPANTGISITGTNALVFLLSNLLKSCTTAITITGGANVRILGTDIETTTNGLVATGASNSALVGCNFIFNNASSINVAASGANTGVTIDGCQFHCNDAAGTPQGTALQSTTGASILAVASSIENAVMGIQCGITGDTNTTEIRANSTTLIGCTTDIIQTGSSRFVFVGGIFTPEKTSIDNPVNVSFAAFDDQSILAIGTTANVMYPIYEILNGQVSEPRLVYEPNYYGNQGTIYENPNSEATCNGVQAQSNNAYHFVVTGDRTKEAGINLMSDTANFGVSDNIRGWGITKVGTSASLAFTYTNNDTSGQAARGSNTVMQLNGFDNQVEFPLATNAPLPTNTVAKLVWATDTNLYRSSANTLQTDGNLVVGGLTPAGVVHNDNSGLLSTSLIVNADVDPAAGIVDTKLATISTAGKVANSATTATSANTPNTIVLRDGSGNFSAGTITAALVGAASLNVLKSGDTMTGNLNLAAQSELRLQDAAGGEYVGLRAPTTVPSSYTVDLPSTAPVSGQFLQASSSSATQWATVGGSPAVAKTYYVALNGSDANDGSFALPFRTVAHAVSVANTVATTVNPIVIQIGAGIFVENNSSGPITITANGISIVGSSITGTIIIPTTLSNDLFSCTTSNVFFVTLTLSTGVPGSTASALSLVAGAGQGGFQSTIIAGFQTGLSLNGTITTPLLVLADVIALGNATAIAINNARVIIEASVFLGATSGTTPANTALSITGMNSLVTLLSNSLRLLTTGVSVTGGANVRILGTNFETTTNGISETGGSALEIVGSNFVINNSSSINIAASGVNTTITINGCNFDGKDTSNLPQGTALQSTTGASLLATGCSIENAVVGIQCGTIGDTSSTEVRANSTTIKGCTTDIVQVGSSTLRFVGGVFDTNKLSIANPTNVSFAAFDRTNNDALTIGNDTDTSQLLFQVLNGQTTFPNLTYQSNYYGNKGTLYTNPNVDATFSGVQAQSNNAYHFVVTGDRTKEAGINLMSDTANFGVSDNIRGWGINKLGTSASLAFTYTNNDTSGQATRGSNTVMQLNGFDNQVEFPLATNAPLPTNTVAKLIWAADTTLYRSAANILKTDGNLIVGGLTPAGIVHNDVTGLLSTSLIVNADISSSAAITDNKLATISTAGKVANSATTATTANTPNTIVLRDGSGNFSAGTITANLTGNVTGNLTGNATSATTAGSATNFTGSLAGDVTGTQGATVVSLVGGQTAGNVASATTAANAATSSNTANTIVKRDGSGNFSAGTITANLTGNVTGNLTGNATSATTAGSATNFTGSLAGDVTGTQGATVVSLVGGQTAANVASGAVAANAATSSNTANTIVKRDGSGNFTTNMITINGTVTNPTDVATKSYVDTAVSTGLVAKTPAVVVSIANVALLGLQTIDGVTLVANNRVLLVGQTLQTQNGLWLAQVGVWTRPLDFASGTTVGEAYVLITSGAINAGSSWLCNTPTAIIDVNPITFVEFSIPGQTTGANVGTGAGQIFRDKTGITLNFKTIAAGPHIVVTNNTNDVTLSTDAATVNTANTLVARDGAGNFSAGTIAANLTGNVTGNLTGNASSATSATTATNFTGSLAGDVTGTQGATVVSLVGGQTAANVAAATTAANAATNTNTASTIVKRDASGNFAAGTITANLTGNVTGNLTGNATTATSATTATNFTGSLAGDVTGTQAATVVSLVGGQTAANVAAATVAANAATNLNTASTIVKRDASGNFSAGTITATLSGNASTATNATNFTGSLAGDVTGTQGATVVSLVGGQTAANVAAATTAANAATNTNTASTIVKRDASGNFAAGTITANLTGNVTGNLTGNATTATSATTATNFTGSLAGDVTGTQGATVVSSVGGQTAANVAAATTAANAATNLNTVNTIVKRDASGNFSAGTITANLTGNVTGNLTGNATTATSATTAGSATNFTGSLAGDVTGTQGATVVSLVGGQTAANVAAATVAANAATNLNTVNTIVKRDASGNFSAGTITANLSGNASTATNATNFTGSLAGDVIGTQGATVVSLVGGQTAANVAAATVAANAATNANTASTIVKRDASGNFSAGTITANLTGNVTGNLTGNATTATSATTATNFTGSLAGDVTGTQGATVVSSVGGQTAANVALATITANAATSANTAGTIVKRDGSGNFSAGTITANLSGNATTATTATSATTAGSATNFTGSLAGDVTGTQGATVVSLVGGQTAANVAAATIAANAATNLNTASTIVKRDGSGNFSAGTITATLSGNASTATNAINFTGSLAGDVTGTQGATVVSLVGGQTAANVAAATVAANAATNTNTANTIVKRDVSGNFSAGTITANLTGNVTGNLTGNATTATSATTATNFTGSLAGDVTGTQGATVVSSVGGQTAANVASATTDANAATSANTAGTIVKRDGSGNFSAGTITASLTGAASLNVLKAGDTMTGSLTLPAGTTAVPSLQFTGSTNTGVTAATANILSLVTAGSERLKIDAAGNTTYKSNYKMYAYRSTTQGINTTTATIIFDVELLDPNANYNNLTGIYTVPVTGVYMINVCVNTQTASAPATETVNIVRNGTVVTGASVSQVLSTVSARLPMSTCVLLSLTAGDLIRVDYTTNKSDTIQPNDTHMAIHFMSF
jgi:hypothetical protein